MSYVDADAPAEERRYLNEHAGIFIKSAGKGPHDILSSYLCASEAQQHENNGDFLRADELFREALKSNPGDRALVVALTRVLGKEGKSAEVRKFLEDGKKGCGDQTCRQEYDAETARQDMRERLVKRPESQGLRAEDPVRVGEVVGRGAQ